MPLLLDHFAEYEGTIILQALVTVDLLTGCDKYLICSPICLICTAIFDHK